MAEESALPGLDSELPEDTLFDVSVDDDLLEEDRLDAVDGPNPYGITWAFDFEAGDIYLDRHSAMVAVSGKDTLRQWIGHTLSIARGESPLYSNDVGTSIPHLYGLNADDGEIMAQVQTEVQAALEIHDKIAVINDIAVFPIGDAIYVYIDFVTDDQEELTEIIGF